MGDSFYCYWLDLLFLPQPYKSLEKYPQGGCGLRNLRNKFSSSPNFIFSKYFEVEKGRVYLKPHTPELMFDSDNCRWPVWWGDFLGAIPLNSNYSQEFLEFFNFVILWMNLKNCSSGPLAEHAGGAPDVVGGTSQKRHCRRRPCRRRSWRWRRFLWKIYFGRMFQDWMAKSTEKDLKC